MVPHEWHPRLTSGHTHMHACANTETHTLWTNSQQTKRQVWLLSVTWRFPNRVPLSSLLTEFGTEVERTQKKMKSVLFTVKPPHQNKHRLRKRTQHPLCAVLAAHSSAALALMECAKIWDEVGGGAKIIIVYLSPLIDVLLNILLISRDILWE